LQRRAIDSDIVREAIADLDLEPLTETDDVVAKVSPNAAFLTVRVRRLNFARWLPRAAVACTAFLVLSAVTFQSEPRATVLASIAKPSNVTHSLSVAPPHEMQRLAPATISSSDVVAMPLSDLTKEQSEPERRITVLPGSTLYRICTETFKTCHPAELNEIRRLNPWLKSPARLKPGQELLIPSHKE
jgi:hypothetical protein